MKIKALLYCVKSKPYLYKTVECLKDVCDEYYTYNNNKYLKDKTLNGKIVIECDFEVEEIEPCISPIDKKPYAYMTRALERWELVEHSCLSFEELDNCLKDKNGYAIHINNLHIFDKPRELSEYYSMAKKMNTFDGWYEWARGTIDKAPQNMMYAYDVKSFNNFEKKIIIPVSPEEMCRIANKEQTIIVRKKVLKEMLKNE